MPNALKIKKTMIEQGISNKIIEKFEFPDPRGNRPEPIIEFINNMDKLLSEKQCLSIMEQQGCCKTGKNDKANREFGMEHKNKTIEEKIVLLNNSNIPYKVPCKLNSNGTLSVFGVQNMERNIFVHVLQ